jgi:hypothetical protein
MGWVDNGDRQDLFEQYGKLASTIHYICDYKECGKPILGSELMVEDPKGGYYEKPKGTPDFLPKKAKRTYHMRCADIVFKRRPPKQKKKKSRGTEAAEPEEKGHTNSKAAKRIRKHVLKLIAAKAPRPYWTVVKMLKRLKKDGEKKPLARKVIRQLRDERVILRKNGYLHIAKGGKTS